MAGTSLDEPGHDDGTDSKFRLSPIYPTAKIFFIILVDAIFTTLFQRPFTNAFDVIGGERSKFLRVSGLQRRLTPSQPKLDNTKKDRIARMYWVRS